jgi:hypothetical protein
MTGTAIDAVVGTIIVLREGPVAATHRWHVTTDGTATGPDLTEPRRLCTLDPQATADLLTLIQRSQQPPLSANPPSTSVPGKTPAPQAEPATVPAARLTLLGGCHLTVDGEPVHLRRTASLQILAYLAIHPDGATRSELTRTIWRHLPPATISQRLHTTLTGLRQQLRPCSAKTPSPATTTVTGSTPAPSAPTCTNGVPPSTPWFKPSAPPTDTGPAEPSSTPTTVKSPQNTWHWLTPVREQTPAHRHRRLRHPR